MIIFKETDDPFNPEWVVSHFNHVFIVVEKASRQMKASDELQYKVNVCYKKGVGMYSITILTLELHAPHIPSNNLLPSSLIREWLLAKCINAETAASRAPEFKKSMQNTRRLLLEELNTNFRSAKVFK